MLQREPPTDQMSLLDIVARVEGREKTLTVYDPPTERVLQELREYFGSQQLHIEVGTTDGGPSGFAVLSDDGRVLAGVDLDDLLTDLTTGGGRGTALGTLLEHLDETTFTSYDTRQMLAATREIEDRAWRVGRGTLHAGFQRASAIEDQTSVYEDLASRDLDVHVYAAAGEKSVDIDGVTVHVEDTEELATIWFVVFDGNEDPHRQCALLAEERGDRKFYGFWTYDPELVSEVLQSLERRYLEAEVRADDDRC